MPCRGTKRSFTSPHTAQTWSVDDVSAAQDLTTTYAIATGSSIEYYPPANAKTVIYKYSAHAGPGTLLHYFMLDYTLELQKEVLQKLKRRCRASILILMN